MLNLEILMELIISFIQAAEVVMVLLLQLIRKVHGPECNNNWVKGIPITGKMPTVSGGSIDLDSGLSIQTN